MNSTTFQTRHESYETIKPKCHKRHSEILSILDGKQMTANEIAMELYNQDKTPYFERNYAAPRLTELEKDGKVRIVGKRPSKPSGRMCAIYEVVRTPIQQSFL